MADPNIQQQPVQHRSACAECQRRKQKCNRQWPCNQCQKRKVASKCAFSHSETSSVAENRVTGSTSQKRSADFEDDDNDNDSLGEDDDIDADAFSKMGYLAGSLVSDLLSKTVISKTESPRPPSQTLTLRTSSECPALESALAALPQRPQMDTLVQIFFNTVNYHYYIIYPPVFLDQYQKWWDARLGSQPLSIEWTALLVIICSVTTQHLDANTRAKIETEMGDSVDNLSVSYLDLTRSLSTAIPIGSYHILNIQRMLHTIYWFKSEARFPEAYLLISEAVGEATELGLHIEARAAGLAEFEREIRRRVWCVLDTWDWQFASGLARPTLIDHGTSSVAQPTLSLEEFTPSPLLHMKLQSEAIALLASRFQAPKNVVTPKDIKEYKGILETWIRNFPAVFSTTRPDESKDYGSPWITHHRFYLHTMAYLMILNPIRRYLAQTFSPETPQEEHAIRQFGVDYSLLNLETTTEWAKVASHRDGRFHFIIFSLFDTVAVLSAAILNDKDNSIPRRTEIIDAIDEALITLKKIYNLSKTAKQSYDILSQLVRRIPRRRSAQSKRKRFGEVPQFVAGQAYGAPALIQDPTVYLKPSSLSSDTTTSPPSQFSSSESAESGSTPQSNHIPTPEYQPAYLEPQVQEPLAPAYPTVEQPCNMDAHYAAHHAQAVGQSQQLLYMNPAHVSPASLQSHNPQPQPQRPVDIFTGIPAADGHIHPMPFEPINDDVMGDFSMLWNWRSLNLPFISSQVPLPGQTD